MNRADAMSKLGVAVRACERCGETKLSHEMVFVSEQRIALVGELRDRFFCSFVCMTLTEDRLGVVGYCFGETGNLVAAARMSSLVVGKWFWTPDAREKWERRMAPVKLFPSAEPVGAKVEF